LIPAWEIPAGDVSLGGPGTSTFINVPSTAGNTKATTTP